MAHPNLRVTLWLSFIAFTSTLNASYAFFVQSGCAYFNEKAVCDVSTQIKSDVSYTITTGFASGTRGYACLTPKWQQTWSFPSTDEGNYDPDVFFSLKDDYCIYSISTSNENGVLLTCINTCYKGSAIQNPVFWQYLGSNKPEWRNPDHGTNNNKFPEQCPGFEVDQSSKIGTRDCGVPGSNAFNIPGTTTPETATVENVGNVDLTLASIGSNTPLLATNPSFNDEIVPTTTTENNGLFSFAQPDTLSNFRIIGDTGAQSQNWFTSPSWDTINLLNIEKRARKSPRDFR